MPNSFEEIANRTEADDPGYKAHQVFQDLDRFILFYEEFSELVVGFPTFGTRAIINIDTYLYSSIQGTLESIRLVLEKGRLGDGFALLRKYHDAAVLNIYTNLYLEKNLNREDTIVQEVTDWLSGNERLPRDNYGGMSEYIEKSEELKPVFSALNKNSEYREMRKRCNDHTHYNSFDNVLINDNRVYAPKRIELLNSFKNDLENIFILHLSYIFYLNDHYMRASDYMDALEVGVSPEPDSQYWVAPFIQEIFSDLIVVKYPEIAEMIKNKTAMHLTIRDEYE